MTAQELIEFKNRKYSAMGFNGTPGKWEQNGNNGIHTPSGTCIATTHNGEFRKSDAVLISCAPEMLEMLHEARLQIAYLHDKFQTTVSGTSVILKIENLINKATK